MIFLSLHFSSLKLDHVCSCFVFLKVQMLQFTVNMYLYKTRWINSCIYCHYVIIRQLKQSLLKSKPFIKIWKPEEHWCSLVVNIWKQGWGSCSNKLCTSVSRLAKEHFLALLFSALLREHVGLFEVSRKIVTATSITMCFVKWLKVSYNRVNNTWPIIAIISQTIHNLNNDKSQNLFVYIHPLKGKAQDLRNVNTYSVFFHLSNHLH